MTKSTITINRAPVLTLWAAVVAEQLGSEPDASLTLGKAVAGFNAQAKGRSLGIFKPPKLEPGKPRRKAGLGEDFWIELCGRAVPAKNTSDGVRAVVRDKPIDPDRVQGYLQRSFGENLSPVRNAMDKLASSLDPEDLAERAFSLYETFRPAIARGKRGWGQKGELDLDQIRSMARRD